MHLNPSKCDSSLEIKCKYAVFVINWFSSSCSLKKYVSVFIAGGLYIASESKEDHIHFLVFTDVCGNRTYGVVAQYYQPMHVCY